jgi:hypothetical protein
MVAQSGAFMPARAAMKRPVISCPQSDAPVCVVASGTRKRYAAVMGPEPKKQRQRSPRQGPRKPLAVRNAKGQQAALVITDEMRRKVENLVATRLPDARDRHCSRRLPGNSNP